MVMSTLMVPSAEGNVVPHAVQGSSQQDGSPTVGDVCGHHSHCHHLGPRGHRSSPSRIGRRLHRHHHRHSHHLNSLAHRHGHGDLAHGEFKCHHHGGHHHRLGGRHACRGLQDVASREQHGSHCRRRMHRSLSPQHLMHRRTSDGSPWKSRRGHKGYRGHCGRGPCDGKFRVISFGEHHLHLHVQEPVSGAEADRTSLSPAAIEQGIEQLGQLSLRSESGSEAF